MNQERRSFVSATLILLSAILAGCARPEDVNGGPAAGFAAQVTTFFDAMTRPEYDAGPDSTDLPNGTPAAHLYLSVTVRAGPNNTSPEWEFDPGCSRLDPEHSYVDCSGVEKKIEYVLPNPKASPTVGGFQVHYPLDAEGKIRLRAYDELRVIFGFGGGPYPVEMMRDPDGCDEPRFDPWAGVGKVIVTSGSATIESDGKPPKLVIDQEAELRLLWYGFCKPHG